MKRLQRQRLKKIVVTLSALLALSAFPIPVSAENKVIRTAEFTSDSQTPYYKDFPSEIEEQGKKYKLGDISYEKLSEDKKTSSQEKTTTVNKTKLQNKSYSVGSTETITVDGKTYAGTVIDVSYTDMTVGNRTGEVNGSQDYGLRVDKPDAPATKSLPYLDELTGQSFNVDAPMTKLEQTGSQWQDYTYIDIVVSNYTDSQFMFNDRIIHHNGSTVLDSSCYPELLSMAGLQGNSYKVSSVNWIGESYKSGNTRYRNARANIQAYSCSYTAYYHKAFSLPDVPSYNAKITFKYTQENVLKTIYKYKAIGYYTLVPVQKKQTVETEKTNPTEPIVESPPITVKTVTTISLILVLSLAFVLLGFFLLTKLKSKDTKLSKVLNKKRRK